MRKTLLAGGVLAAVKEEVDALGAGGEETASDDVEDDDSESTSAVIRGGLGTALGALALIVALAKKRA